MTPEVSLPPFELAPPVELNSPQLPVLIVEDDRATRMLLEKMIRTRGHTVVGCESAEAAFEKLATSFFPLIVLDIQLPGMSGLDFSTRLRSHPQGRLYYILAGTGNNRPEDLRTILEAGANDYIAKPYQPGLLDVRLAVAESAVKDIAERRRLEGELEFLAEHDPLTKLFNRRGLAKTLARTVAAARQGRPGAILYLDLDNFKVVNDTLGHDSGDRLLLEVVGLLRESVRPNDVLVRFGGDEFVVILPACEIEQALEIGERLRDKVENLIFVEEGKSFRVGASIGVAPVDGSLSEADLLGLADAACYAAKAGGRNRVELYRSNSPALQTLVEDSDWASKIRAAMKEGNLLLHFQPIVSTNGLEPFCHEVLIRLHGSSTQPAIHPAAFMSAVQRSGLAAKLDRYVIHRSVQALLASPDLVLSVNISAVSLADPDFQPYVKSLLSQFAIAPERIIFELTENEIVSNMRQATQVMQEMREFGLRFAIDDFGSGSSSLTYLKLLPIDLIKIDGSFVRHIVSDSFNQAVVSAVQALAGALGIPTVAEYVESEEAVQTLQKIGVEYIQGYHVGEPSPLPLVTTPEH